MTRNEAAERLRHIINTYLNIGLDVPALHHLDAALATERRLAVIGALEAVQEHLACACGGIEGHLRTRGLSADPAIFPPESEGAA